MPNSDFCAFLRIGKILSNIRLNWIDWNDLARKWEITFDRVSYADCLNDPVNTEQLVALS